MALSKDQIDLIVREVAPEILGQSQATSAFMRAGKKITLTGHGSQFISIDLYDASWVEEGAVKPTVDPNTSTKKIDAHTLVSQFVVTKQTMNDFPALYRAFINQGGPALATAFDRTFAGYKNVTLSNFDTLKNLPTANVTDYPTLVAALGVASATGSEPTAVVASSTFMHKLSALTYPDGRPMFDYLTKTILGLPVYTFKAKAGDPAEAFVGNFDTLLWGDVEGIEVAISEQATVGGVSMFETNQVAIRIEARYGAVADLSAFVRITANPASEGP